MEELNRKKQIFFEHCEAVKRDPSEVQLTLGVTLVLVESEKDGKAILDSLTPERRAMARVATLPQAQEMIGTFMEAGFTGFTFNNNIYGTDESMARAGELIKVVNGYTDAGLGEAVSYQNTSGMTFQQPLGDILLHLFNHQTHHRGQAHACLSILTVREPPSLDLLVFQRGGTAPTLEALV